jgi:hypothetical protein
MLLMYGFLFCLSMFVSPMCIIRNRIKETAEHRGIPTFVVADAGRTQVCFTYGFTFTSFDMLTKPSWQA